MLRPVEYGVSLRRCAQVRTVPIDAVLAVDIIDCFARHCLAHRA